MSVLELTSFMVTFFLSVNAMPFSLEYRGPNDLIPCSPCIDNLCKMMACDLIRTSEL